MFRINTIAVIGSGIMGSSLACHFAGIGFRVILFDLPSDGEHRNKIIEKNLQQCLNIKPSNIFHKKFIKNIELANLEDDLSKLNDVDWVLEAIVENIEIKKNLYSKIDSFLQPTCILSSNTSSIPLQDLAKGLHPDLQKRFIGTHFFNPPRYLKLLEIIPTQETSPEIVRFFQSFGKQYLGKETIICKDSPAFIANRIGVVSMAFIFQETKRLNINISDVDKITGVAIGRPNSGTFRLTDIVGLDTADAVLNNLKMMCPKDKLLQQLNIPDYWLKLLEVKSFGEKTGRGFYFKSQEKDKFGKNIIQAFNLQSASYEIQKPSEFESLKLAKQIDDTPRRIKALTTCQDPAAILLINALGFLFAYSATMITEICNQIYELDLAMKNGFAWEYGPFEYWDVIGFEEGLKLMMQYTDEVPEWILKMKESGITTFYKIKNEQINYFNIEENRHLPIPAQEKNIRLSLLNNEKIIYTNDEMALYDIGDHVLCLEFRSKNNIIGEGILRGIVESVRKAEEQHWEGIVLGNNAVNFSVGANLILIGMFAFQQQYDQLDYAVNLFQQTSLALRYAKVPIVAATQGYVFGGGTEFLMHCDAAVVSAESYLGLVEVAVGILPGGGGTKEFALRLSDEMKEGEIIIPQLIDKFRTLAMGQVATSAFEAFDYSYLQQHRDNVSISQFDHLFKAKQKVLQLAQQYLPPLPKKDIKVLGQSGLGTLYGAAHSLLRGGYASEHDIKIAKKIAYVLCGGELSSPQLVSEQYLLDLEREAFLSLCTEPKTLERIQYMLEHNKPLRN